MSSHHVVKEDQEPALFIINPNAITFEKIQELLEWSPLVIVSHDACEAVLSWGIKIDAVLVPEKMVETFQITFEQDSVSIIRYHKNETQLSVVCRLLQSRKQSNLNVIVTEVATHFSIAKDLSKEINLVLLNEKTRWHYVSNGMWSKWLPPQTSITIFHQDKLETITTVQAGIFKLEKSQPFWLGEEF